MTKTKCRHGHTLADAYVFADGKRRCRTCKLEQRRQQTLKQQAQPAHTKADEPATGYAYLRCDCGQPVADLLELRHHTWIVHFRAPTRTERRPRIDTVAV